MIRSFLDANFLLRTDTAVELYRRHAEKLPVADYHTRLRADLIAANEPVADLTTLWLDSDPDKWRLMRAGGVSEDYISGNRTPYEKFEKWAEILPQAMRHPIYHQAHMELNRVFGIGETLKPSNARDIYESCTAKLQTPEYLPQAILRRLRIETLATTDDPADSLNAHLALRETGGVDALRIIPTWAPDRVLDLRHPEHYNLYLDQLAAASDTVISTYNDLLTALRRRHKAFGEAGCVATLHRLTTFPDAPSADDVQAAHEALRKVREGGEPCCSAIWRRWTPRRNACRCSTLVRSAIFIHGSIRKSALTQALTHRQTGLQRNRWRASLLDSMPTAPYRRRSSVVTAWPTRHRWRA